MNFGMNNMGGSYNNRGGRGGGYNNRGNMNNMNYSQNRSFSGPMGGGFQGNPMGGGFQGGPMGGMPSYGGGFQNRGGMMGGMRGGGGGMRGGRGGMGGPNPMMAMGGMPSGMGGMPNPMGGMGMGNMGMQGMTGFSHQSASASPTSSLGYKRNRTGPMAQGQAYPAYGVQAPPASNAHMPGPVPGRAPASHNPYQPHMPGSNHSAQQRHPHPLPQHPPTPKHGYSYTSSPPRQTSSRHTPSYQTQSPPTTSLYYSSSPNRVQDRHSPEKLKRDRASGQAGFGGPPHFNPAFFQGGGGGGAGGEGNWNPHGAKRTRQE